MTTDCVGIDTSKFEFSFDCETAPGQRLRHSFGVGGFDDQEDFDTSIKCSRCIEPVSLQAHQEVVKPTPVNTLGSASPGTDSRGNVQEATPTNSVHFLSEGKDAKKVEKKEDAKVAKYGPDDCVSTWRDAKTGVCFVKTDCKGKDTTQYLFGLVCEDADGSKVRHSFGKDSFDAEETFDTLIPCHTCLAMDKVTEATELQAENAELATEINALAGEIGTLKDDFKDVEKDVSKLNEAVAAKKGGAEKKEEPKAEEKKDKAAAETSFYLTDRDVDESYDISKSHAKATAVHVKKQHNSQKKRKQRHQKSNDDEAEDDDDDADDEETSPQRNFRHKNHKKSVEKQDKDDSNDDSDDSDDDGKDD